MNKPSMRSEIGIVTTLPLLNALRLKCTLDAAPELAEFGELTYSAGEAEYWLQVDPRFDYVEVVEYIMQLSGSTAAETRTWLSLGPNSQATTWGGYKVLVEQHE